jgi:5'-methylthioadenosine phosphorylase
VDYMKRLGGDIIGQSFAPEVFLARDIGACYAGVYLVVNYGEGVVRDWDYAELEAAFQDESRAMSGIVLDVVAEADLDAACRCAQYRKPTLLGKAEDASRDAAAADAVPRDTR